jgi:AcrR family transcriptional regulator
MARKHGTTSPKPAPPEHGPELRLRADARDNRKRVLAAAEAVFGVKGPSASTEEVAQAAGVGVGTVFRHFPTKAALLQAIVLARLQRLSGEADALLAESDPAAAFETFFRRVVAEAQAKRALGDVFAHADTDFRSANAKAVEKIEAAIGTLLERAQGVHALRRDVGVREVMALLSGASAAVDRVERDPQLQDRTLRLMLDGLRPSAESSA